MIFNKEKKYKIRCLINNVLLTYSNCEILNEDNLFVEFKDNYKKTISVNKSRITNFEAEDED